jgi:hypothetical protein
MFLGLRRAVAAKFTENDWTDLGTITGTSEIIREHPRLLRSLYHGDEDYETCVGDVLEDLAELLPIDYLVNVVDDLIDLDTWLRDHHPQLYRELFAGGEAAALTELEAIATAADVPEIHRHVARIRHATDADPAQAIGSAKELIETVCRVILADHGLGKSDDLMGLAKQVRVQLDLGSVNEGGALTRVLSGHAQIVQGIAELRNLYGTGHGRSKAPEPEIAAARLVVDSASALALYYLTLWRTKR